MPRHCEAPAALSQTPLESLQRDPKPGPSSSLFSQFLVYDYDSSGKHDFIGEFTSTFQEMQEGTANPGQEVPKTPWENPEGGWLLTTSL